MSCVVRFECDKTSTSIRVDAATIHDLILEALLGRYLLRERHALVAVQRALLYRAVVHRAAQPQEARPAGRGARGVSSRHAARVRRVATADKQQRAKRVLALARARCATERRGAALYHARRIMVICSPLSRLFWHCGAHTTEPKIGPVGPISPIPY